MTPHPGEGRKSWRQRILGWLYRIASTPGWRRRLVLAAAVAVFVVALLWLCGGADYREDPSALTPRTVSAYVETRDLDAALEAIGGWRLWTAERRDAPGQLRVDIAGILGGQVPGLGTRQPLAWLAGAERAAFAYAEGEGGRSWALYINVPAPESVVKEFTVEPDLTVARMDGSEVYSLSGKGGGRLFFSVAGPWLVISSDSLLPTFALSSIRKPAYSLASSGVLPAWKRGVTFRGLCAPSLNAEPVFAFPFSIPGAWLSPEARITFTSRVSKDGGADTYFLAKTLSEEVDRGGARALFLFLLAAAGLIGLVVAVAIVLTIIGWGGLIKAAAMRAGVVLADAPAEVEPSAAFVADSGAGRKPDAAHGDALAEAQAAADADVISVEAVDLSAKSSGDGSVFTADHSSSGDDQSIEIGEKKDGDTDNDR